MNYFRILVLLAALVSSGAATFRDSFELGDNTATVNGFRQWRSFNEGIVQWNTNSGRLDVTWDSRKTNSFYYYPLPVAMTRSNSFAFELTLRLSDLQIGIDPSKNSTFEICIGFLNLAEATRTNYFRGSGVNSIYGARSVIEFTYFPDDGFGATVGTIIASTNNQIAYSHTFPVELALETAYHIRVAFDASTQSLTTAIDVNGAPHGEPPENTIRTLRYPAEYGDFRVDAFSIHSYSDAGQIPPQFAGSILAHGTIDDVSITYVDEPIDRIEKWGLDSGFWSRIKSYAGWNYRIERTIDFANWETVETIAGTGGEIESRDLAPPPTAAFYRWVATPP